MNDNSLVSIIVTTKNEQQNIKNCLESISHQTYKYIEIIVVDNNSTDDTKNIARKLTKFVYNKGPERSAQRNFGAEKAHGKYLLFLDADMIANRNVVEECVQQIQKKACYGVIIPEESIGKGFWAACKRLERSYYHGIDWIEAPRFFSKDIFKEIGGYDEKNTGTEDYDFPQRIKKKYGEGVFLRTKDIILHNEGNLSLQTTLKKKYYYGKKLQSYKNRAYNKRYLGKQASILARYILFFSSPTKLFRNPFVGTGMLFMKTMEFIAGGLGLLSSRYL